MTKQELIENLKTRAEECRKLAKDIENWLANPEAHRLMSKASAYELLTESP